MKRILFILAVVITCFLSVSCQKTDGEIDYGNTFIYIPQATAGAGLSSDYFVPSGTGENTRNFKVNGDNIDIMLGVLRSGKEKGEAFSVDIVVDRSRSSMPEAIYTLPSKVEVKSGSNQASFYLSVSKASLSDYAGKKLNLILSLANPSRYELAEKNISVNIILDVDALKKLI